MLLGTLHVCEAVRPSGRMMLQSVFVSIETLASLYACAVVQLATFTVYAVQSRNLRTETVCGMPPDLQLSSASLMLLFPAIC